MAKDRQYASLLAEDFTSSTFLDDVDLEVLEAQAIMYAYKKDGKVMTQSGKPEPALQLRYRIIDPDTGEGEESEYPQRLGLGKSALGVWEPSEDGMRFVKCEDTEDNRVSINENSKAGMFLSHLQKNCGFPKERIEAAQGKLNFLDGLILHVIQVPIGKLTDEKTGKPVTAMVPNKIVGGLDGKPKKRGRKPKQETEKESPDDVFELDTKKVTSIVVTLLFQSEDVDLNEASNAVYEHYDEAGEQQVGISAATAMREESWIGSSDRPWNYSDGVLTKKG